MGLLGVWGTNARCDSIHAMPASLYIATSFDAAWETLILPWFKTVAARAPENGRATAVVTPFRSHAHLLRSKLLASGISLLGVHFLVPAQLREFLQRGGTPPVPLREHLRLLLACAAEECAVDFQSDDNSDDFQIAKAVAREPDRLLHAIDAVIAAGATFSELASPALAEIVTRFHDILKACGCVLLPEADRLSLRAARARQQPRFSNLLITGFDAAHWSLWPLLRAAVSTAKGATVILRDPRYEAAEPDRIWICAPADSAGQPQRDRCAQTRAARPCSLHPRSRHHPASAGNRRLGSGISG
jgi:hypothetical protein